MSKTKIFAHRGASGYAPENTLEAFALAITQGADGIELDVQLTKDGIPVVIHDETIDRVTEKTGFVKDYTLKELKELTVLGNKFPEYSSSKIPTLEEVLDAVKASGIQVNIELKTGIYWYPEIEQKVADLVKKAGMEELVIYAQTWAERIAERFRGGRQLPVKNSYMYCDTLDMSFFFGETGTPYMTYAGYVTADSKDITEEKLVEAFRKAGLVLEAMKELAEKAGGTV